MFNEDLVVFSKFIRDVNCILLLMSFLKGIIIDSRFGKSHSFEVSAI